MKVRVPSVFPSPLQTPQSEDYVVLGGEPSLELMLDSYSQGIFPWPDPSYPHLIWSSPAERGILRFKDFRVSRSLQKFLRNNSFQVSFDLAFERVVRECATAARPGQKGTWITPELIKGYLELFSVGCAHSVEVWEGETLVGGVYGVYVKGVFSAESMFYKRPNASKLALARLIEKLQTMGLEFLDIQVLSPRMLVLVAQAIKRSLFLKMIRDLPLERLGRF